MSVQDAKKFIQLVRDDVELQRQIQVIKKQGLSELIQLAHGYGLDFSPQEYQQVLREEHTAKYKKGELKLEDLEKIAGGVSYSINAFGIC